MPKRWPLLAVVCLPCLCAGCATLSGILGTPGWVRQTPQSKTAIYAVASWPRMLNEQEARDKAKAAARNELAKTLQVRVRGVLIDWQSQTKGSWGAHGHDEDFIATISKETLDVSMSGSQIVSVWCDRKGTVSLWGTWWALAKLDKSSLAEELHSKAREALAQVTQASKDRSPEEQAKIEEQARKAFEDLDKRLGNLE